MSALNNTYPCIIVVTAKATINRYESRVCDKLHDLLATYNLSFQIVRRATDPTIHELLSDATGDAPMYPQFFVESNKTTEIEYLGEFHNLKHMLVLGELPGQEEDESSSNELVDQIHRKEVEGDKTAPIADTIHSASPMQSYGASTTMRSPIEVTQSINSRCGESRGNPVDTDDTEESLTDLVLLEDEPDFTVEVVATSRMCEEEEFSKPIALSRRPTDPSTSKTYNDQIFSFLQREQLHCNSGSSVICGDNVPSRCFVTPINSFCSNSESKQPLNLHLAPRRKRNTLNIEFDQLLASSGSFRQKLVRGHSLLQCDSVSRSGSFCSQQTPVCSTHDELTVIPFDKGSNVIERMKAPHLRILSDSKCFVTPVHSFIGGTDGLLSNFVEPNQAPARSVVTLEDFEQRCTLDTDRQAIMRGPSILNNSFSRSVTRGVSRYATDDSLPPLKEEVIVDRVKCTRGGKRIKEVKIVVDKDHENSTVKRSGPEVQLPPPSVFGLVRKSSILRHRANCTMEDNSSQHTKTTVDVSSSEDNGSLAPFSDHLDSSLNGNQDNYDATYDDDDASESSTQFEEQNEDALPLCERAMYRSSVSSEVFDQSWLLLDRYD